MAFQGFEFGDLLLPGLPCVLESRVSLLYAQFHSIRSSLQPKQCIALHSTTIHPLGKTLADFLTVIAVVFSIILLECTGKMVTLNSRESEQHFSHFMRSTFLFVLRFTGSNSWHTYAHLFSTANVTYKGVLPIHFMQASSW